MAEIIMSPFFEASDIFSEDIFLNTWTENNVEELNRSLEAALSPTNMDSRYSMGSPDSGLDYDFNEALIGVDDPIFSDISNVTSSSPIVAVEVIRHSNLPVTMGDFTSIHEEFEVKEEEEEEEVEDEEDDDYMEEEEEDEDEDEENEHENIQKNHPVEIHSYSIIKTLKLKNGQSFKAKNSSSRNALSGGKKYKTILSQKKAKLYEMAPLTDPAAEKNRLNALNAKKNRDRKKAQLAEAETEISRLREENDELRSEAEEVRDELDAAKRELSELRSSMKMSGSSRQSLLGKTTRVVKF